MIVVVSAPGPETLGALTTVQWRFQPRRCRLLRLLPYEGLMLHELRFGVRRLIDALPYPIPWSEADVLLQRVAPSDSLEGWGHDLIAYVRATDETEGVGPVAVAIEYIE